MVKVIFEDEQILVVKKPSGVVVNRSETNKEGTLQDEISKYFGLGLQLGIGDRAGIVHRLDRETSGVLVIAKTQKIFDYLQAQFKDRLVEKEYIALVHGKVGNQSGTIEEKIARVGPFGKFGVVDRRSGAGREARTDWELEGLYRFGEDKFEKILRSAWDDTNVSKARLNYLRRNAKEYSLLTVFPKTGRTHQIRVHLKSIGHPVVSDLIYGPNKLLKFDLSWCPRLFLHAKSIEFVHPKTKKRVKFTADLPEDLAKSLRFLTKNS